MKTYTATFFLLLAVVGLLTNYPQVSTACVYDSECGVNGLCRNALCVAGGITGAGAGVGAVGKSCKYDSDCGPTGRCLVDRCLINSSPTVPVQVVPVSPSIVSPVVSPIGAGGSPCRFDADCGAGGRCVAAQCQTASGAPLVVVVQNTAGTCTYDAQCGLNSRCVSGTCLQTAECTRNLDCLSRGLYFECNSKNKCVQSEHKICRSNDDCKKNWLNRKCVNDRCSR